MAKKPMMLCILDGFGWVPDQTYGNAIAAAKTPYIDHLFATCPHVTIGASGMSVGLPDGQMGNSEVGHTNIGAGRIVYQQLTLITKSEEPRPGPQHEGGHRRGQGHPLHGPDGHRRRPQP